jgi:hypothetical protein
MDKHLELANAMKQYTVLREEIQNQLYTYPLILKLLHIWFPDDDDDDDEYPIESELQFEGSDFIITKDVVFEPSRRFYLKTITDIFQILDFLDKNNASFIFYDDDEEHLSFYQQLKEINVKNTLGIERSKFNQINRKTKVCELENVHQQQWLGRINITVADINLLLRLKDSEYKDQIEQLWSLYKSTDKSNQGIAKQIIKNLPK